MASSGKMISVHWGRFDLDPISLSAFTDGILGRIDRGERERWGDITLSRLPPLPFAPFHHPISRPWRMEV